MTDAKLSKQDFYDLTVAEVIEETHDAKSYVFDVPAALAELFEYKAGQFLTFEIPWGDFHIKRSYSLASTPVVDALPKVTIKRVPDGRMSNWFNDNVKAGDVIRTQPPAGRFVRNPNVALRPILLFGGGSGITPVISLLKDTIANSDRRAKLVYASRDVDNIIFKDEIIEIAAGNPDRVSIAFHLDSEGGFLTQEAVVRHASGWEAADCYICGPTPFMDTVETGLEAAELDDSRVQSERFVSPVDPDRTPIDGAETTEVAPAGEKSTAEASDASGEIKSVSVVLEGELTEVPYDASKSILQATRDAGVEPEFQCLEGYCGCCMAKVTNGTVEMSNHDALSDKEVAQGWIVTCCAKPTSADVKVDFDAF